MLLRTAKGLPRESGHQQLSTERRHPRSPRLPGEHMHGHKAPREARVNRVDLVVLDIVGSGQCTWLNDLQAGSGDTGEEIRF